MPVWTARLLDKIARPPSRNACSSADLTSAFGRQACDPPAIRRAESSSASQHVPAYGPRGSLDVAARTEIETQTCQETRRIRNSSCRLPSAALEGAALAAPTARSRACRLELPESCDDGFPDRAD